MGEDLDPRPPVSFQVEVRVMLLPLGKRRDVVQHLDSRPEISELPITTDPGSIVR